MTKIITKEEIENTKSQLKTELEELRKNYIGPFPIVVPEGVKLECCNCVNMMVTSDDINYFTLGLYLCDAIEKVVHKKYTTKDVLYILENESYLNYFLKSNKKRALPMGVKIPDYYFLEVVHLMITRIKDNISIKVKVDM